MTGRVLRVAIRRGIVGGSRPWLYVAFVVGGWRLLRRLTRGGPEVVFRDELAVGTTLVLTNGEPASIMER